MVLGHLTFVLPSPLPKLRSSRQKNNHNNHVKRQDSATDGYSCAQRRHNPFIMTFSNDKRRSLSKIAVSISLAALSFTSLPRVATSETLRIDSAAIKTLQSESTTNLTSTLASSSNEHIILKLIANKAEAEAENEKQMTSPVSTSKLDDETETTNKSHIPKGDKLANYLRSLGIAPSLIVLFIASLPVLELRAAVPVGLLLFHLPVYKTMILSIIGNLIPLPIILYILRLPFIQSFSNRILSRARRLSQSIGNSSSKVLALAAFVGIPFPMTGAYTGTLVCYVLDMSIKDGSVALVSGVVLAATIMTILCELGWIGAVIAGVALVVSAVLAIIKAVKGENDKDHQEHQQLKQVENNDALQNNSGEQLNNETSS